MEKTRIKRYSTGGATVNASDLLHGIVEKYAEFTELQQHDSIGELDALIDTLQRVYNRIVDTADLNEPSNRYRTLPDIDIAVDFGEDYYIDSVCKIDRLNAK